MHCQSVVLYARGSHKQVQLARLSAKIHIPKTFLYVRWNYLFGLELLKYLPCLTFFIIDVD